MRCLYIERCIAEDEHLEFTFAEVVECRKFLNARPHEIGTNGVIVAEAPAGEPLPETKVAELVRRTAPQVPRRETDNRIRCFEGCQQLGDSGKDDTALASDPAGEELEVTLGEPVEIRYRAGSAEAMAFEAFEEDAAVGAAIEQYPFGRMFDAELLLEGFFHGPASRPIGADHRHVDIEEQDSLHSPEFTDGVAYRKAGDHDPLVTIELQTRGARALIEPRYGGRLHQLFIEIDGEEVPLLWSPGDLAEYERKPLEGGCYPMAPWPNRIRGGVFRWQNREFQVPQDTNGEALHGLVFEQPWDVVARVGRVVEMACDIGPAWPWQARAWQRIELGPNFLAMKMEVRAGRDPFPAGCGWHPWFLRDAGGSRDVRITVPAASRYVLDAHFPTGELVPPSGDLVLDGRPLGRRVFDDCYTGFERGAAAVRWERLNLGLAFDCTWPHLHAFARPEAFCLEPQTCAPDAFNLAARGALTDGTAIVAPGRPLAISMRWRWDTDQNV